LLHVLHCIRHDHDGRLLLSAALVCIVGVFASFAVGTHAHRSVGRARRMWTAVSILSAGCTAWATHFVALLAFRPALPSGYEPVLTATSLLVAIVGLGTGVMLSLRSQALVQRFAAGAVIGLSVAALHYMGQAAYVVRGQVHWDPALVAVSVLAGTGLAMLGLAARGFRNGWRRVTPPVLLLLSIAVMHFWGMAAMTIRYDPAVSLPPDALSPEVVTPVVAGVCIGLLGLAIVGLWLDMAARIRIRRDQQRLRELADVALEGLLLCRGDHILTANSSVADMIGRDAATLAGGFVSAILPGLDVPSLPEREEREAELITAGGQPVPVRVLRREVTLGHRRQTVLAVRDQRERLRTEEKMRMLAFSDPLTGLLNRTRFYDLFAVHAASRRIEDRQLSVLMIDLDRFKPVNDTHGHAAGDLVLRMVGDRLRAASRGRDLVARLGGDEFAILVAAAEDAAEALAGRIVEELGSRPFLIDGQAIFVGASIGIASAPRDGTDPADLLHNADLALYAAKADGKGRVRQYDPALDERLRERRRTEDGLRRALAEGGLELHYQPLVDSGTGRVTSAEALVRWRDPERGLVPPAEFIGVAEETGLIGALGDWVMRTACLEAAGWPAEMTVAVNLSPVQFREPGLARTIRRALDEAGLAPSRLELEITEGVLLTDERRTLDTLNELRGAGVRISMDDFGTGYSSLSYLRRFPFDKIKIDQSFVRQLPQDPESAAIIRAIISMGRSLGMTTTVEGVETADQFAFSRSEGCDYIQGFLVSRPLPAEDFRAFLGAEAGLQPAH